MEDYLEAIYRLSDGGGSATVSEIAAAIGVKRPSVSKALKRLSAEGLVAHTPYGGASVTRRGREVAQAQVDSHRAITRFLQDVLQLPPELAEHDACLMEHAISPETVERLARFIDHLDQHGQTLVARFRASVASETGMATVAALRKGMRRSGRKWTSNV